jgi:predicted acyl esterase
VRGAALAALAAALAVAPATAAAGPLGLEDCLAVEGVHQCSGLVQTWDGVPLDVTVTLPRANARRLPLVADVHGFGNSKSEYLDPASQAYTGNAYAWARDGYAVLTHTARGLWGSCGTPEARLASPQGCARGYIHLADTRYEVRDIQELIGRLVDEGVADPRRLGVTGDSYGGGQSIALASLRDRVMLPDGRLVPWRTPRGRRLRLAAAAPVIPWTNVVYAIAPNGRTRALGRTPIAAETNPVGVFQMTIANAIFAAAQVATGPGQPVGQPFLPGRPEGYLAPLGLDPEADVGGWVARSDLGEPYDDPETRAIVDKLVRFHSAEGIPHPDPPPLFIGSGFTDDLFPVDEVLRFARRLPRRTPVKLLLGDFGHQRAANKPADRARLLRGIHAWFDHYLRGDGPRPRPGVVATTQTCPRSEPSGGPFRAPRFGRLARRSVRFAAQEEKTLDSAAGSPQVGAAIDPAAGGGDGCVQVDAADQAGTATYRIPVTRPYTLLGAPVVRARLAVSGAEPSVTQVASRLWDVAPDGTQRLVARGSYRPAGSGRERFELHPNGWRFARGHVVKLELLGNDAPYSRPSNAAFSIDVSALRLRLPVR